MEPTSQTPVRGALALSLLHVPCCGLTLAVMLLGASGVAAPWIRELAHWAEWSVPFALGALGWSWWRLSRTHTCAAVRRQRWILVGAATLLVASVAVDHLVLPTLGMSVGH